jgi:molybdopterin/thiamine biosynthesis adenylyltransferase
VIESFEVRVARGLWRSIDTDLRAGPRDDDELERAGFLLCGVARLGTQTILLGRVWRPIPLEAREQRIGVGLAWLAAFNAEVLDEADRLHAVPLLIHRHDSARPARLSLRDREHGDPMVRSMSELSDAGIAATIVLHEETAAGLMWWAGALSATLERVRVVGVPLATIEPTLIPAIPPRPRMDRQTVAIGPASDQRLARAVVAVAGTSGGGGHVCQQLAHAGVGTIIVVDDDTVDTTSRGRLVGTRYDDDGQLKTDVMERLINEIDRGITVVNVPHRTSHPDGRAALARADVIVAAVDRLDARAEINAIARRYLVPLVDVGIGLESDGARLISGTGQVIFTLPGGPCLRCTPLLSDAALAREQRLAPLGYDRNPDAPGEPQVVSMNGLLASQAVTVVIGAITGYLGEDAPLDGDWWQYDGIEGQLDHSKITFFRPSCPGCAEEGHGDPWFLRH